MNQYIQHFVQVYICSKQIAQTPKLSSSTSSLISGVLQLPVALRRTPVQSPSWVTLTSARQTGGQMGDFLIHVVPCSSESQALMGPLGP